MTTRDAWVYSFSRNKCLENCRKMIDNFNSESLRYQREGNGEKVEDFVDKDPTKIKWNQKHYKFASQGKTIAYTLDRVFNALHVQAVLQAMVLCGSRYVLEHVPAAKAVP